MHQRNTEVLKTCSKCKSRLHMKQDNCGFLTFLTHPNFLVLFLTGSDSQPSNLDSEKINIYIKPINIHKTSYLRLRILKQLLKINGKATEQT